ncbi:MAG: hypothetical protein ACOYXA_07295, partial [Bacteroidota bacterium]
MKTVYFIIALLCIATGHVMAQNKSLGVGTPAPNPNAALHVESPTGNQGFIMPRLTTAQRAAMAGLLAVADEGLMLFDTDLNTIFIWDGTTWRTTAEVAGGAKLGYPYKDSVIVATGTTDVFALKYNAAQNARVLRVENLRADNASSALSVLSNGTGLAGYFQVNNPTSGSTAVFGTTNSNIGGTLAPVGVYGESTGTGSLGGAFWNTNAANNFPALYTRTQGTGSAATLEIVNPANTAPVLVLNTNGTGNALQTAGRIQAGQFAGDGSGLTNLPPITFPFTLVNTDAPDGSSLLNISTNAATSTNIVSAASFSNLNPLAISNVLRVTNAGSGAALFLDATGTGSGGRFQINNPANNLWALTASTNGGGDAFTSLTTGTARSGFFRINNPANNSAALVGETNGGGIGVHGINNNASAAGLAAGVMGEVNSD